MMNHPHLYMAIDGENTTRFFDGSVERFTAGQAGVMQVGKPGFMQNSGTTANRLVFTWLQTPGTPLTSPATPPEAAAPAPAPAPVANTKVSVPRAGDGGLISAENGNRQVSVAAGVVTMLVLATVAVRQLKSRRK